MCAHCKYCSANQYFGFLALMCSWLYILYWYQLCKYCSFSLNWVINCSHMLCQEQEVKFVALKFLVTLSQECSPEVVLPYKSDEGARRTY